MGLTLLSEGLKGFWLCESLDSLLPTLDGSLEMYQEQVSTPTTTGAHQGCSGITGDTALNGTCSPASPYPFQEEGY